eukprot:tig00000792_g4161.t1
MPCGCGTCRPSGSRVVPLAKRANRASGLHVADQPFAAAAVPGYAEICEPRPGMFPWRWLVAATAFKALLVPAYRSTDFEVHRNWLAITHSLPLSRWYYDETSPWTLDYPPFFAWFEWVLSFPAALVDARMVDVKALDYASPATVYFQRFSVILTELLLVYAAYRFLRASERSLRWPPAPPGPPPDGDSDAGPVPWPFSSLRPAALALLLLLFSPGLLFVDHIHFQYNGFLFGLLVLSLLLLHRGHHVAGGAAFAALLNFKHIFAYVAPAVFFYLLRAHCTAPRRGPGGDLLSLRYGRLAALGTTVLAVFALSLGPFAARRQLGQLAARLFPLRRGLMHAYWAPNFWALYAAADKALSAASRAVGYRAGSDLPVGALTGGLVGEAANFGTLPSVTPLASAALLLLFSAPLWKLVFARARPEILAPAVAHSALVFFLFGWHVHEKAILIATVPLGLVALRSPEEARLFTFLSAVGHYSLFPLLYRPTEYPLKLVIYIVYTACTYWVLRAPPSDPSPARVSRAEALYLVGMACVEGYAVVGHGALFGAARLPFLPLMLTSVYCAAGVAAAALLSWRNLLRLARRLAPEEEAEGKAKAL